MVSAGTAAGVRRADAALVTEVMAGLLTCREIENQRRAPSARRLTPTHSMHSSNAVSTGDKTDHLLSGEAHPSKLSDVSVGRLLGQREEALLDRALGVDPTRVEGDVRSTACSDGGDGSEDLRDW